MDRTIVEKILEEAGYEISNVTRYKKHGYKLKLAIGDIVVCEDSNTIWFQGKHKARLKELIDKKYILKPNNKVFIVYGHEITDKRDLADILRGWNLEPIILEELPPNGKTIIEQLEDCMNQVSYGIVLITPDDIGCSVEEVNKKYRARQNVILELGMLFQKINRSRVALIVKNSDKIELPSDLHGIRYLPYKEKISEISNKLVQQLNAAGYKISI